MKVNPRLMINETNGKLLYDTFVPRPLQEIEKELVFDFDMLQQIINANNAISKLNFLTSNIESFEEYVNLYVKKDLCYSLKIADINCDLKDMYTCLLEGELNQNIKKVNDYINVFDYFYKNIDNLTFDNDLLKKIHSMLIINPNYNPGQLRDQKNISKYLTARIPFLPPAPEEVLYTMGVLEDYLNDQSNTNVLVKAALVYYQLIAIRPFLHGNGRVIRMFINLYLLKNKVFNNYIIYLSHYFYKNKSIYQEKLHNVQFKGDFEGWIEFFLKAVEETSKIMFERLMEAENLYHKIKETIFLSDYSKTIKNNLIQIVNYIKFHPYVSIKSICTNLNKSYPTVANAIEILVGLNIIEALNDYHRNRIYFNKDQLGLITKY